MSLIKGKQIDAGTITAANLDTTNGAISTVNSGDAAVEGSGTGVSRRDHQHAVATGGTTASVAVGDAAAEGSSANLAREDHQHPVAAPAAPANVTKAAASAGAAATVARADHKHDVTTAVAVELTDSTNAEGASTALARANHTHAHGNRGGAALHASATPSVNGFMSSTDKTKLDSMAEPVFRDPKNSVRLLQATVNVTPLSGTTAVDGVATVAGDRVGVFGQSTVAEDGIYITAAGAWTRAADFALGSSQAGAVIPTEEGVTNPDSLFLIANDAPTDVVGTDDLVAMQISAGSPRGAGAGSILNGNDIDVVANADGSMVINANDIQVGVITEPQHGDQPLNDGLQHAIATTGPEVAGYMSGPDKTKLDGLTAGAAPNFIDRQETVTSQLITNADVVLTDVLNNIPLSSALSLSLYLNGVHQRQGAGLAYTVNPTTGAITWLASTGTAVNMQTTDDLWAVYSS